MGARSRGSKAEERKWRRGTLVKATLVNEGK